MDKPVNRVMFSAVVSETGEQVNELQHTEYIIHDIEAQSPDGGRIVPVVTHVEPSESIKAYYVEYVWDDQGDGK